MTRTIPGFRVRHKRHIEASQSDTNQAFVLPSARSTLDPV
jgi:hypothetical protein